MARFGLCKEVGQRQIAVRTRHQVGMVLLEQFVFYTLGHAAQYAHDERALALHGVEGFQSPVYLLLGIVAHRAGVQQHCVGLIDTVAGLVARHLHDAGHYFRVGHIHLAAVGLNI